MFRQVTLTETLLTIIDKIRNAMSTKLVFVLVWLLLSIIPLSASAQDYYELYKPEMIGPDITVISPQNNSIIETDSIELIFNLSLPQIVKLSPNIPSNILENNAVRNSTDIFLVYYKGDWQTEETILYSNNDGDMYISEFNETISNIPNGEHQIEIEAVGSIRFTVAMFGFEYHPNSTSTIIFTFNSQQSENYDAVTQLAYLLLAILVAAIAVIPLKRKLASK